MQLPFRIDLKGKVAIVTGGSGVLGSVICKALAAAGAKVAILARSEAKINGVVDEINKDGYEAFGFPVDVLDKETLEQVHKQIIKELGSCSILVNAAGGNHKKATTAKEFFEEEDVTNLQSSFFDLDAKAIKEVFHLNFLGTLLPTQIFAQDMIGKKGCTIINISSMNAYQPLTKIPAYSSAKASISNFTQWLAVHFSKVDIRVNAIAPGFFLTEQNRSLLIKEDGDWSNRAHKIIGQTPMGRFGEPEELLGTLLWLIDEKSSSFVNGIVVPVDGGFSSYSGV